MEVEPSDAKCLATALAGALAIAAIAGGVVCVRRSPRFREDPAFAIQPAYQAAMATAQRGDYPAAAAAFAALAEQQPRSSVGAWARWQEAICRRAAGERKEAERAFERVVREYPQLHLAILAREALDQLRGRQQAQRPALREPDPHCGPKCLLFVCQQQGIEATLDELVQLCQPGRNGTSMAKLAAAARAKGLHPEGLWVAPEEWGRLTLPAIAWVDRNHFVVVTAVTSGALQYYDPAEPDTRYEVRIEGFKRRWDGYVLTLHRVR